LCTLADAVRDVGGGTELVAREPGSTPPVGPTGTVLVREDFGCAYPVVDGIPILLAPEMLTARSRRVAVDLRDPRYAEAYEEMGFYNDRASSATNAIESSNAYRHLEPLLGLSAQQRKDFPNPWWLWLDATYDSAAQGEGYAHLAPMNGKRMLQLGGTGTHAVKFVLAGARNAWLSTPVLGEVRMTLALARAAGVGDRIGCVIAIAEELPFASGSFDGIFSGGCVHHMVTRLAFPEAARVLVAGGRFAANDPWRAPLYAIGTRLLGKREPEVYCRPLTAERIAPLNDAFADGRVIQHGTLTRYPLLALQKFGLESGMGTVRKLGRIDDAICSLIPGLRGMGSSIAILGRK
jgi:SAM-dependent methyltransferase